MEIMLLISLVSVVFGVYQGTVSLRRDKSGSENEGAETVKEILEHIKEDVNETRENERSLKEKNEDVLARLGVAEASATEVHERIDGLGRESKRRK
ncbi:MAG: hypothetical protein R3Y53_07280 [Bacillota bacterium]